MTVMGGEGQTRTLSSSLSPPGKIIVIGGGTGSSTVLKALMLAPFNGEGLTAIATTFDDGGGTGELRKVYPELPAVGDLRQCFDAMSELSDATRHALASRFSAGDSSHRLNIEGQTLGNLIIARAIQVELLSGGTFSSALRIVGELLRTKGTVVPPSNDIRTLVFDLPDGTRLYGEHETEETQVASLKGTTLSFLDGRRHAPDDIRGTLVTASISQEANIAIRNADLVVIAPGDLYTSIAPNLAVEGMRSALEAAGAVIMITNLMNRDRHTVGFSSALYAEEMTRIIGSNVISHVLYNIAPLESQALDKQLTVGSQPVVTDSQELRRLGFEPHGYDLVSRQKVVHDENDMLQHLRSDIRHDPAKVSTAVLEVWRQISTQTDPSKRT